MATRSATAYHAQAIRQLDKIQTTLHLSGPELGALFDVSRQAVAQWSEKGVPLEQLAAIDRVYEAVEELTKRFKPLRLPSIVRSPLPILDNRSILQALVDDGPGAIFELFRRWSSYIPDIAPIRKGSV